MKKFFGKIINKLKDWFKIFEEFDKVIEQIRYICEDETEEDEAEIKVAVVEYGEDETIEKRIAQYIEKVGDVHWYYYDLSLGDDELEKELDDLRQYYNLVIVYQARPTLLDGRLATQWDNVKLFPFL